MKIPSQLILLFLAACTSTRNDTENAAIKIVSTQTISVYEFASNHAGNTNCSNINRQESSHQASYRNIYPGKTLDNDLMPLLGEPTTKLRDGAEINWFYDNYPVSIVSIIVVNNIVDRIEIDNYDVSTPSLKQVVEEYGCPKLIYVIDRSEHSSGKYDSTVFLYPEIGVEFWFDGTSVAMSGIPRETQYFKPSPLANYIQLHKDYLYIDSPISEPVYWNDVVVDK